MNPHLLTKNAATDQIRRQVNNSGFSLISRDMLPLGSKLKEAFADIGRVADTLPVDLYGNGAGRARIFGKAIRHPDIETHNRLVFQKERVYSFNGQKGIEYFQPENINPDQSGRRRIFPGFPQHLYENPAFQELVEFSFECTCFESDTKQEAMELNFHLIRLAASERGKAVASPNCIHVDGQPYTAAFLVDRVNVIGGENFITDIEYVSRQPADVPSSGVRAAFTLERPMDGYIVDDAAVAHYVAPVQRKDPSKPGYRTILLIDFTPLRPALVNVAA